MQGLEAANAGAAIAAPDPYDGSEMKQPDPTRPASDDRARFPGEPVHMDFMDSGLKDLWDRLEQLPHGLRLIGGTALALYLNHRASGDLDFATPSDIVDRHTPGLIPAFATPRDLQGGAGMVSFYAKGQRDVIVTLMECGVFFPAPAYPPRPAPNGVAVSAPADLVCSKLMAAVQRDTVRDFVDLAAAERRWPGIIAHGIELATAATGHSTSSLIASLDEPPPKARNGLENSVRNALQAIARQLRTSSMMDARRQRPAPADDARRKAAGTGQDYASSEGA